MPKRHIFELSQTLLFQSDNRTREVPAPLEISYLGKVGMAGQELHVKVSTGWVSAFRLPP